MPECVTDKFIDEVIPPAEMNPGSLEKVERLPPFAEKIHIFERFYEAPFFELDIEIQDALVLRRLQQMISTILLNPLWRSRLMASGLSAPPKTLEEWQQIPLSDMDLLRDHYAHSGQGVVVPLDRGGFQVVSRGGTQKGEPAETVFSYRELRDTYQLAGRFLGRYLFDRVLKGTDPKWMITTMSDYQMWSGGTSVGGILQQIPGVNFIGAGPVGREVYHHMLSYPGPKAMLALSHGLPYMSELGLGLSEESRRSLKLSLYCGGAISPCRQRELKEVYPEVEVLSWFSTAQAEAIGLQLTPNSPLVAIPGLHFVEVVDEAGRWVANGEEGELVVTRLHSHSAPLLRFKPGDRMVRRADRIGPGLKARQFEFAGRSDDVLRLGAASCSASQFYDRFTQGLKATGIADLSAMVLDIQFINFKNMKILCLMVALDEVDQLGNSLSMAGDEIIYRTFRDVLGGQMTDYRFELRPVHRFSEEIYRTMLGKTPLVREIL